MDTITNLLCTGVKVKATSELKLSDSPIASVSSKMGLRLGDRGKNEVP